jgi:hypothetical protein
VASSQHQENTNWHDEGQYPYKRILGGDGMQIQVDTRDNNTVYTGYQFGHYFKVNKATSQEQSYIHPHEDLGEAPLRFNWQTPIWLSKHQQDIFYMGSNRFHRSLQQGENLQNLSNDLTQGKKEGDVPYGTITTIAESSLKLGLMYLGTDDGLVWMSNDIGYNWKNISAGLPKNLRVMRVTPSNFVEGRIYVALSGFQFDHFNPYLFVSNDYGNTWKQIGTDLPHEPVNVMKEDLKNKNLLYVGTDNGLYCSLNEGKSFMSMMGNLPRVAVHDIALQNQADEIIVGTHGRSIYKTSLNEVRMLCDTILSNKILSATQHRFNKNWGKKFSAWGEPWEQSQTIHYFSNENTVIQFELLNSKNNVVRKISDTAIVGLNTITFNFQLDSVFIQPILNKKGKSETNSTYIKAENNQYYCPADKYKWVMKIDNKQVNEYKWELKSNLKEE